MEPREPDHNLPHYRQVRPGSALTSKAMTDEFSLSVSVPLDSDGFLRRECPTCEREFKWWTSPDQADDEETPVPDGGYFCPYCAIQAPPDAWHTRPQIAMYEGFAAREVLGPEIKKLQSALGDVGTNSGGLIEPKLDYELPPEPEPLSEDDDMRRVDFSCHPDEPVKVLDGWEKPVHCLLCGSPA